MQFPARLLTAMMFLFATTSSLSTRSQTKLAINKHYAPITTKIAKNDENNNNKATTYHEGRRPLKNATKPKLIAFVSISFIFSVIGHLAYQIKDPSTFTCTAGTEGGVWCKTNAFDVAVTNAVVLAPMVTGVLSHAFTIWASSAVGIGTVVKLRGADTLAPDLAIYFGTQFVTKGINSIAKGFFRRQRPCYHFGRQDETEAIFLPEQEFKSFYSADATMAFSLYTAALAVVTARGWRTHAMKLSKVGGVVALIGSILRIVGFMHWCTDVLVGIILGILVGFGLPTLLFSTEPIQTAFAKMFAFHYSRSSFSEAGSVMTMDPVHAEERDSGRHVVQGDDRDEGEIEVEEEEEEEVTEMV